MTWTVETVSGVDAEIEALPVKLRARLIRLLETVENVGLEALGRPHVKHLDGKLWELAGQGRRRDRPGDLRNRGERRVVVLHVFAKKSRKTPQRALATARQRMKQVTP